MHERSIVRELIEQIEGELQRRSLRDLTAVRLEIGEFTGIEPSLLALAFAEMSVDRWQREVSLELDIVSLTARCRKCAAEFPIERFRFLCPHCGHGVVDVIAGEDLRLIRLTAAKISEREQVTS